MTALNIVRGDDWNKQHIVDFAYSWDELNATQKSEMKKTVWFQLLENALINLVTADSGRADHKNSRTKLLAILSDKLNIDLPEVKQSVASNTSPTALSREDDASINSRQETESQETQSVETSVAQDSTESATVPSVEAANNTSSNQTEVLAQLDQDLSRQTADKQNSLSQDAIKSQPNSAALVKSEAAFPQSAKSESVPARSNQESGKQDIASFTQLVRQNTHKVIRTPPSADAQELDTRLAKNNNSARTGTKGRPISDSELKKLTTELVNSYEKGNISSFTSLFAANAVSNDEADLNTIKQDYANLFSTTSDRRMIIGDIKWNFSNNTAVGDGQMEVAVKANGANRSQKYTGKIQIVVEKQPDGVQITKLLHVLK